MSSDLAYQSGGMTSVSTESLEEALGWLTACAEEFEQGRQNVQRILWSHGPERPALSRVDWILGDSNASLYAAKRQLSALGESVEALRFNVKLAALGYEGVDNTIGRAIWALTANLTIWLNRLPDPISGLIQTVTAQQAATGAVFLGTALGFMGGDAVRVVGVKEKIGAVPVGMEELVKRIPSADEGERQIRIEQFTDQNGNPKYVVYLAGTVNFGLLTTDQPNDMASNVAALAGADGAAYAAAIEAMRQAGITKDDPVTMVGFSQGGLLATRIASTSEYKVENLVTIGSPGRGIDLPPDVNAIEFEHKEDWVPALGGSAALGASTLVVTRSLFDDKPAPTGKLIPAHDQAAYAKTAKLFDQAKAKDQAAAREKALSFFDSTSKVSSTAYISTRVG